MTAAHCVVSGGDDAHPDDDLVVLYRDGVGAAGGDVFREAPVDHVVEHPDWTGDVMDGADVALIVLKSPLEGHPTLKVLPQPDPATWVENKKLYVVGWGIVGDSGAVPSGLQGGELLYHSVRVCNGMYRKAGFGRHVINGDMLCAGADGAETCLRDSGGPLIIKGATWEHDVGVGIVSFGNSRCGDPSGGIGGGVPGVFTRLRSFAGDLEAFLGSDKVGVTDNPVVQSPPPGNPRPSSPRSGDDESATGKGWCSFAGGCQPQNRGEGVPFCDESANLCEMACGGVFCTEGGEGKLGGSPSSPDAGGRSQGQHEQADAQPPPSSSKGTAGSDSADACASTSEGDELPSPPSAYQSIVITITITISSPLPTIMIIVVIIIIIIIIHIIIIIIIIIVSSPSRACRCLMPYLATCSCVYAFFSIPQRFSRHLSPGSAFRARP